MKTLTVILHYNTPQYTDVLYELLQQEQGSGNYELIVIDNGSSPGKESKYASYKLEENVFFGGGLDVSMRLVLNNKEYDSLLFLNSDLIVGRNFVKSLRMDAGYVNLNDIGVESPINYDIISPCIIQPEKTQNHWKQMIPHGSVFTRNVKWIDLQSPLISKKFIEHLASKVKENDNIIDGALLRGWGIDVWFGMEAGLIYKTGVCDNVPAIHLGSMTMKELGNTNEYCQLAEKGMYEFFNKKGLMKEFVDMRKWAENYTI